jgi:hypothetical protein
VAQYQIQSRFMIGQGLAADQQGMSARLKFSRHRLILFLKGPYRASVHCRRTGSTRPGLRRKNL